MSTLTTWKQQELQQATSQAELDHAQLYLELAQTWSLAFTTMKVSDVLNEMDEEFGNLTVALQRVADPQQLDQPEITRDFALTLFTYFDKRGLWDDWIRLRPRFLEACQRLGDAYSLGEAYPTICNNLGIVYRTLGKYTEALSLYTQALHQATRDDLRSDALTNMADIYRLQGEANQAIRCAQQAIDLGHGAADKTREAKGLEYLGLTYMSLKEYSNAVHVHQRAVQLRRETENLPRIALSESFLAAALSARGTYADLQQSLIHFKRASEIDKALQNWQGVTIHWSGMAVVYSKLGEYQKAVDWFELALEHSQRLGIWRGVVGRHIDLAKGYLRLGRIDKALFHAKQACHYRQHMTIADRKVSTFCDVLLELVHHLQQSGNTTETLEYIEAAIEFAIDSENTEVLQTAQKLKRE